MSRALLLVLSACGRFGFGDATRTDGGNPPDVPGLSLDATIVADGVASAPCGMTVLMQDSFDVAGAAPNFTTYTSSGLTLSESSGELHVVFGANVGDGRYAGYKTASKPTEGLCGSVHVLETAGSNGISFFKMGTSDQQIEFSVYGGYLSARTHLDRQVATLLAIPFDNATHGWWRLRQQAGVTYWDVSSDGVSYSLLASTTFITDPMMFYELGAGSFGASSAAGQTRFDEALVTGP